MPRLGRYWNTHVHALGQGELLKSIWISGLKHTDPCPCPTSVHQCKLRSKDERKICLTCLASGQLTIEWNCKNLVVFFADRPGSSRLCHRRLEGGKEKMCQEAFWKTSQSKDLGKCRSIRSFSKFAVCTPREPLEPFDGKRHGTPVRSWRVVGRPKSAVWPRFCRRKSAKDAL